MKHHYERGSAIVEFAFSATLLCALIFGIFDVGYQLYVSNQLTTAAQFGSRYAMAHGKACTADDCTASNADIVNFVKSKMVLVHEDRVSVAVTRMNIDGVVQPACTSPGCTIEIKATYTPDLMLLKRDFAMSSMSRLTLP